MTFRVCAMLTMSKFFTYGNVVKTRNFQGSRFQGNVCNIALSNFHEIITPLFYTSFTKSHVSIQIQITFKVTCHL